MPKKPEQEIYCKFCNRKLADILIGCRCKKKSDWKNPYSTRHLDKKGGAPRKNEKD